MSIGTANLLFMRPFEPISLWLAKHPWLWEATCLLTFWQISVSPGYSWVRTPFISFAWFKEAPQADTPMLFSGLSVSIPGYKIGHFALKWRLGTFSKQATVTL